MKFFTQFQVAHRGILYVSSAMLTAAIGDIKSAFDIDVVERVKFWLQLIASFVITLRAYIDQTPSQTTQAATNVVTPPTEVPTVPAPLIP